MGDAKEKEKDKLEKDDKKVEKEDKSKNKKQKDEEEREQALLAPLRKEVEDLRSEIAALQEKTKAATREADLYQKIISEKEGNEEQANNEKGVAASSSTPLDRENNWNNNGKSGKGKNSYGKKGGKDSGKDRDNRDQDPEKGYSMGKHNYNDSNKGRGKSYEESGKNSYQNNSYSKGKNSESNNKGTNSKGKGRFPSDGQHTTYGSRSAGEATTPMYHHNMMGAAEQRFTGMSEDVPPPPSQPFTGGFVPYEALGGFMNQMGGRAFMMAPGAMAPSKNGPKGEGKGKPMGLMTMPPQRSDHGSKNDEPIGTMNSTAMAAPVVTTPTNPNAPKLQKHQKAPSGYALFSNNQSTTPTAGTPGGKMEGGMMKGAQMYYAALPKDGSYGFYPGMMMSKDQGGYGTPHGKGGMMMMQYGGHQNMGKPGNPANFTPNFQNFMSRGNGGTPGTSMDSSANDYNPSYVPKPPPKPEDDKKAVEKEEKAEQCRDMLRAADTMAAIDKAIKVAKDLGLHQEARAGETKRQRIARFNMQD